MLLKVWPAVIIWRLLVIAIVAVVIVLPDIRASDGVPHILRACMRPHVHSAPCYGGFDVHTAFARVFIPVPPVQIDVQPVFLPTLLFGP